MRLTDRPRQGGGVGGRKDEMDVVGHQAIGPAGDAVGSAALGEQIAIESVIARLGEQRLATVAPLRDVMRQAGDDNAGETRHSAIIARRQYLTMCILSPNTRIPNLPNIPNIRVPAVGTPTKSSGITALADTAEKTLLRG